MTDEEKNERIAVLLKLMDKHELASNLLKYQLEAHKLSEKVNELETEIEQLREGKNSA
jgi:cell division protein FtsB